MQLFNKGWGNDNFTIYAGKSIYLDHMSLDNQYTFYDNFSCGVNIIKSRYQYNMGIQYLGDIGIIFGSSLTPQNSSPT